MIPLTLTFAGCGVADYWAMHSIASSRVAELVSGMRFVDHAHVSAKNALTCPLYRGAEGRPKADRLAEIASAWLPGRAIRSMHTRVESIDWPALLHGSRDGSGLEVAIVGLDDWSARLAVAEDLRAVELDVPVVQLGLARDEAQIFVSESRPWAPCSCCGIDTLPASEPCVAWTREGALLRGDLQREARAAGRFVASVLGDLAGLEPGAERNWMNTKTNLTANGAGDGFEQFTRSCRARSGCLGPHGGAGPIRWDRELGPVLEGVG